MKCEKNNVSFSLFVFYLFYNDYETCQTTYINHDRWHRFCVCVVSFNIYLYGL